MKWILMYNPGNKFLSTTKQVFIAPAASEWCDTEIKDDWYKQYQNKDTLFDEDPLP